jgi:hypothetical protein
MAVLQDAKGKMQNRIAMATAFCIVGICILHFE